LFKSKFKQGFLKVPLVVWSFGFAFVTILWFLGSSQSEIAWREVRGRLSDLLLMLSCLMIFANASAVRSARWALVFVVLFGTALNIYEFFVPMTFSLVHGRSAGLFVNSNLSGEALVLGMILSVTILPSPYRGPFLLLTGIGVFATFSRGGIGAWLIAMSGLLFFAKGVRAKDVVWTFLLSLLVVGIFLLPKLDSILKTMDQTGVINKNTEERLAWLTNPSGVSDDSSWSRMYVAQQAWRKFADHPWLGGGTGTMYESFEISPHNQYLSYMLDYGVVGATIVPLLIVALLWGASGETRRLGLVFATTILWFSFFTHTILSFGHSLVPFALLAAMVSTEPLLARERAKAIAAGEAALDKALSGA
jgi:O-antigen ligase